MPLPRHAFLRAFALMIGGFLGLIVTGLIIKTMGPQQVDRYLVYTMFAGAAVGSGAMRVISDQMKALCPVCAGECEAADTEDDGVVYACTVCDAMFDRDNDYAAPRS